MLDKEIASGGMATVHVGRILGDGGFTRPVAIKRLHPHLARDPVFVEMLVEEARLAARVSHPNVVATLDVVASDGELLLVMDYVAGHSVSQLLRAARAKGEEMPLPILASLMIGALAGLHAAHEASDEAGNPLGLVHRDVSPQNLMVGLDGRARVVDFGVAKATARRARERTRTGVLKGKLGYMAPEQFDGKVTRRSDVYAAAVVLWEALAGRRLFDADSDAALINSVLAGNIAPPSTHRPDLSREIDAVVLRGLDMDPASRFATADAMAIALAGVMPPASVLEVAQWVQRIGGDVAKPNAPSASRDEQTSLEGKGRAPATRGTAVHSPQAAEPRAAEVMTMHESGAFPQPHLRKRGRALAIGAAALVIALAGVSFAMRATSAKGNPLVASAAIDSPAPSGLEPALSPVAPSSAPMPSPMATEPALESKSASDSPKNEVTPSKRAARSRSRATKIIGVLDSRQ